MERLLRIVQEIRNDPHQNLKSFLDRIGISKSQFYKDRSALAEVGFLFDFRKSKGFIILEDRLSPVSNLTLSDRLIVMFALKSLSASGDGHLVAKALEVGRKLAGGLEEPFRTEILETFDRVVLKEGYGCKAEVLDALEKAIAERRRIWICYRSSTNWKKKWRTVDPRHLYFLQRALYLYAYAHDEEPKSKSFRVSRIEEVQFTDISCFELPEKDDFYDQLSNAFLAFIGPEAHEAAVRFTGKAARFVKEGFWHHSQEIEEISEDEIVFRVKVALPKEVIWWSRQFGDEAIPIIPSE